MDILPTNAILLMSLRNCVTPSHRQGEQAFGILTFKTF